MRRAAIAGRGKVRFSFFASATTSFTVFAGSSAFTAMMSGSSARPDTALKSLTGSYGSFE